MNCQSCGMPMTQVTDHGGGRPDNVHCQHCTDSAGNLKSKEEIKEGMVLYSIQSAGKTREEAETEVNAYMAQMPAWSGEKPAWKQAAATASQDLPSPVPAQPTTAVPAAPPPAPTPTMEPVTQTLPETPVEPPAEPSPVPPTAPTEETTPVGNAPVSAPTEPTAAGPLEPPAGEQTQ